ncbi:MAG: TIGR02757 family protein [Nitrospirae bacterium]|nr:TIGR02757 family protein [Nitrospirota bacterium]
MTKSLKQQLEKFYREYDFAGRILFDPIEFPHQYSRPEDIEVVAFIASCFAYGKVDLFKAVLKRIFAHMGQSPCDFLAAFNVKKQRGLFADMQYRFNRNDDIVCLLYVISRVLRKYGSLEAAFRGRFKETDKNIGNGLSGLVDTLLGIDTTVVYGDAEKRGGFLQFLPSPSRGSACKRMNMFLRWMVRDRDIDFGLWKEIPKNKLVIPLDVHIARISKCLGFTRRATADWKMAVEITESLKAIDPDDPVKYDFALCHQGITRVCSSKRCSECKIDKVLIQKL